MIEDWSKYPNFTKAEFDCKETQKNDMQPQFMEALQKVRAECGFPFPITSGFRSLTHSREIMKTKPGYHPQGLAADIACNANDAWRIAKVAIKHGMSVGVSQKEGLPRFVHVDLRPGIQCLYSY
jgi:uncharacterized protein YcbK (DUF882 family)